MYPPMCSLVKETEQTLDNKLYLGVGGNGKNGLDTLWIRFCPKNDVNLFGGSREQEFYRTDGR